MRAAPERFATARLEAHRVGVADEEFLVGVFADDRVTCTLGGPRHRARVRADIQRWNDHWDAHGFGLSVLARRDGGGAAGWVLLGTTDTGGSGGVEIGWTIAADHQRQGFATEAAISALAIGFTDVGLDALVTFTLVDNLASRGVMEKLGFVYDGAVEHAGLPHVLYRLDRTTWEQRNDG